MALGIATAQWKEKDARAAVHDLVDALNTTGQGFDFSQDTVLKSGLVLADVGDVGFKVKNFTTANMALESSWDDISTSLLIAAELLADFGSAKNYPSSSSACRDTRCHSTARLCHASPVCVTRTRSRQPHLLTRGIRRRNVQPNGCTK